MNRTRWNDELEFTETDDTLDFTHALRALWNRRPATDATQLAVGVNLFHLLERTQATPSLFTEGKTRTRLNRAVDALNERFGRRSAYFRQRARRAEIRSDADRVQPRAGSEN